MSTRNPPRISVALSPALGAPCYYCGIAMEATTDTRPTRDHAVPRRFGGTDADIVICCARCNRMKRDLDDEEYIAHCMAVASHRSKESFKKMME